MGSPSTGSVLATSTFASWLTRAQQFKLGCASLLIATHTANLISVSLFVLPQRPFTSLKLLRPAFQNSVTPSNFVKYTILRIWGAVLVERLHIRRARQVVHRPCREWQPRGVHLYVKLGVLQTPTVDKASTLLRWQDEQRQPRPGIPKLPWLGIKRHLVREMRHPPLDSDRLIRWG
jgi:hypothetical protein